jgi:hypothetical protein
MSVPTVTERLLGEKAALVLEQERLAEAGYIYAEELADIERQLAEVNVKLKEFGKADDPVVSDHAIVRYLERVQGIDIQAIRDTLLTDKVRAYIAIAPSGTYPAGEGFRVRVKKGVLVTTYSDRDSRRKK